MPRSGLGMPIVSGASNAPVTVIDDVLWEDFGGSGGEIALNYQETRTNIVLHSQDVTDSEAWTKQNTAISTTLYEAPDNSTTANAIKSNTTGSKNYYLQQQSLSVTAGKTYTASVHLKKGALGFGWLRAGDGTTNYSAVFNLNTGAVTNTSQVLSTSVDAMDDDWFRCSVTFQAQNTSSNGNVIVFAQIDATDNTPNVAASGVELLYVWGWQLEESIEATSYIVTTTSARTATTTLNDTSDVWDFDSADIMPEADLDSEGVWEVPANVVLNGDYEELGSELVTDGNFPTGTTAWTVGSGWNIANGIATASPAADYLSQASVYDHTTVETYKITYDITVDSGTFQFLILGKTGSGFFGNQTTSGTYTVYFTTTGSSGDGRLFIAHQGGFDGDVNSVSVKQVDPNNRWTLGTGWSISDGKASFDASAASTFSYLTQASILSSPLDYELTFTLSDLGGSFAYNQAGIIRNGVVTSFNTFGISTPGTHTIIVTETSGSNFFFFGHPNSDDFSIDNVTVREYAIQPQDV